MKPCSKNRKLIAWLAMDALDAEQARQLRAHLETCAGCRRYLDEISTVKEKLTTVEIAPDLQASAAFRRRWVDALSSGQPSSAWEAVVAQLRGHLLNWRVVLPALGATVLVVLALSIFTQKPLAPSPVPTSAQTVSPPKLKAELSPTLSNYQRVANQSLGALDELLTRQGNRNLPQVPVYTASLLAPADAAD
jgi:hypothetical protein